ncbi:hypothetical protein GCM10009552_00670 [Rothia nasimurium]
MVWLASLLALFLGWWLAGVFNLYLLGLPVEGVPPWNSYGPYVRALGMPELAPFVGKVRVAGLLGFGSALVAWGVIAKALQGFARRMKPTKRKAAPMRFAPGAWIDKAGYTTVGPGRPLWGRRRDKRLTASGHLLVVAPQDERWHDAFVLPNLLAWEGPALVVDRGGRVWRETSGYRASLGQVRAFAPFGHGDVAARWNPLDDLPRHEPERSLALQAMARHIYTDHQGHRPIPHDVVRAFLALALFVLDDREDALEKGLIPSAATLGDIWTLCAQAGGLRKAQMKRLADKPFIGVVTRDRIERLLAMPSRDLDVLMSRAAEPLRFLADLRAREAISASDIDLTAWASGAGSLYVGWPDDRDHGGTWLVSYILERALVALAARQAPATALCVLDGPDTIGSLPSYERSLYEAKMRGVRVLQRTSGGREWVRHYGEAGGQRALGAFDLRVFAGGVASGGASDPDDLFVFPAGEGTRFDHRRWPALAGHIATQGSETLVALQRGIEFALRCDTLRYDKDPLLASRRLPPVPTMPSPGDHAMPSKTLKTVGATAALALAASATTYAGQPVANSGPSVAMHDDAPAHSGSHASDAYDDKPVEATLGSRVFAFPRNMYARQQGPDFQGSVSLMLRWPDLKAYPPGAIADPAWNEAYLDDAVAIQPLVVEGRTPQDMLDKSIQPNAWDDAADPSLHLRTRKEGEPRFGLTPYYIDRAALRAYLEHRGAPVEESDLNSLGKDWYVAKDAAGHVTTFIQCSPRELKGAALVGHHVESLPVGVDRGMCKHVFVMPEYGLWITTTYLRAYLEDWKKIQDRVIRIFHEGSRHEGGKG